MGDRLHACKQPWNMQYLTWVNKIREKHTQILKKISGTLIHFSPKEKIKSLLLSISEPLDGKGHKALNLAGKDSCLVVEATCELWHEDLWWLRK